VHSRRRGCWGAATRRRRVIWGKEKRPPTLFQVRVVKVSLLSAISSVSTPLLESVQWMLSIRTDTPYPLTGLQALRAAERSEAPHPGRSLYHEVTPKPGFAKCQQLAVLRVPVCRSKCCENLTGEWCCQAVRKLCVKLPVFVSESESGRAIHRRPPSHGWRIQRK
jgi:hypothetical protein